MLGSTSTCWHYPPRSAGDVVETCVDAVLASQNRPKALRRWPSPGQPRSTAPVHLGCGRAQRSSAVRRSDTARTGNRSVRFRKWNRRRRPPDVSISRMVQSREDRSRHIRALAHAAALSSGGALDPELRVSLNFHPDPLVHGLLSSKRSPGTVCTGHSSKQELVTVGLPRILTETAGSGSSVVRDDGVGRQS